jgi:hypothetical protein
MFCHIFTDVVVNVLVESHLQVRLENAETPRQQRADPDRSALLYAPGR